jgi:mannose-6-phosphate isomerase-like protein (cupin superfamily)
MAFDTKQISSAVNVLAPDGSEVRVLCQVERGGMAHFTLSPGTTSKAVVHRTVEEIWYFISGHGRMWRRLADHEEIVDVGPGTSVNIPVGTEFQLRSETSEPLVAIGATMPPWPGEHEAYEVAGPWPATIQAIGACVRTVDTMSPGPGS